MRPNVQHRATRIKLLLLAISCSIMRRHEPLCKRAFFLKPALLNFCRGLSFPCVGTPAPGAGPLLSQGMSSGFAAERDSASGYPGPRAAGNSVSGEPARGAG